MGLILVIELQFCSLTINYIGTENQIAWQKTIDSLEIVRTECFDALRKTVSDVARIFDEVVSNFKTQYCYPKNILDIHTDV